MSKRYSPVHVVNPLSDMHMVYLHPNQSFSLECSKWMNVVDVEYASEFFNLVSDSIDSDENRHWLFEQTMDLTPWTKLSNTYLGDVTIIMKDSYCTLCVMMLSENPSVITLINPTKCEIKVQPHQILEMVLYGDHANNILNSRSVSSGHLGLIYREQGYEELKPVDTLEYIPDQTSLILKPRNIEFLEHHFWFGMDGQMQTWANSWTNGVYHGGRVSFGAGGEISVTLSVNVKKREKVKPIKQKSYPIVLASNRPTVKSVNTFYYHEPNIRDVELIYMESATLEDGCKTLEWHELKSHIKHEERSSVVVYGAHAYGGYSSQYDELIS